MYPWKTRCLRLYEGRCYTIRLSLFLTMNSLKNNLICYPLVFESRQVRVEGVVATSIARPGRLEPDPLVIPYTLHLFVQNSNGLCGFMPRKLNGGSWWQGSIASHASEADSWLLRAHSGGFQQPSDVRISSWIEGNLQYMFVCAAAGLRFRNSSFYVPHFVTIIREQWLELYKRQVIPVMPVLIFQRDRDGGTHRAWEAALLRNAAS